MVVRSTLPKLFKYILAHRTSELQPQLSPGENYEFMLKVNSTGVVVGKNGIVKVIPYNDIGVELHSGDDWQYLGISITSSGQLTVVYGYSRIVGDVNIGFEFNLELK